MGGCNIWVAKCDGCTNVKIPSHKPRAPLGEMPIGAPLHRVATDILDLFPEPAEGNRYVFGVTDYFKSE